MKLTRKRNKEYQSMTLPELLDTTERFHIIEDKGSDWSVVRKGCSCTRCYQWCVCGHNVLFDMMLNAARVVPEKLELTSPSLRKLRTGSRGVAGTKRKLLLARIERDKKTGVKKSKKLKILGPNVSYSGSCRAGDGLMCVLAG